MEEGGVEGGELEGEVEAGGVEGADACEGVGVGGGQRGARGEEGRIGADQWLFGGGKEQGQRGIDQKRAPPIHPATTQQIALNPQQVALSPPT